MKNKKKIWIMTDCDGVWLGRAREREEGDNTHYDYANLHMELEIIRHNRGYELIALTDRGGAQLPVLAYFFQGSQFQFGESGAVAYNAFTHSIITYWYFDGIIERVKQIRQKFEKKFQGYSFCIEPGVYSSIRVERHDSRQNLTPAFEFLTQAAEESEHLICADHGDCISLKPREINKKVGMRWMETLYRETQNPIDFPNSLWIGDGAADIAAAEVVLENGGQIAGVANSHPDYRNFLKKNNGYIAEASHTRGLVEILKNLCD